MPDAPGVVNKQHKEPTTLLTFNIAAAAAAIAAASGVTRAVGTAAPPASRKGRARLLVVKGQALVLAVVRPSESRAV